MTIEKFDEMIRKSKEALDAVNAEIKALLQRDSEIDAEIAAAAEAGDVALYKANKAAKDDVAISLHVKRTRADKLSKPVTKEDAFAAWDNYVGGHNKKLKKALADFAAERDKFNAMYAALVDLQNEACVAREHLAAAVDVDPDSFKMDTIPCASGLETLGLLSLGGSNIKDPDANYYLACYSRKTGRNLLALYGGGREPETLKVTRVVHMKRSV